MSKQSEQNDKYFSTFPTKLRELLENHPKDSHSTTYKALGEAVGIRQQTVSLYASGQTQPTVDILLKIAQFFDVSVDYLLTGISSNNKEISDDLGLDEDAIQLLRQAKRFRDSGEVPAPSKWINELLSDSRFYTFLEDIDDKANKITVLHNRTLEEAVREDDGKNMEGYYIWDLQMYVQEFIRNQLNKHGMVIDRD